MSNRINLKVEDRDTLHLKVCNVLRKAILNGDFKPGERLKQSELAEQLGVSRMPVREALRKLESEGLVILEPHKGAIVKSIQIEDVREIYELRAKLESMAIEQSMAYFDEEDYKQLKELVEKMENTDDIEQYVQLNIEFHQLLIKKCPWQRLLSFIETLWNGFPQETPHFLSGQTERSKEEHRKILSAILAGNKKQASDALAKHILNTGSKFIERLRASKKKSVFDV